MYSAGVASYFIVKRLITAARLIMALHSSTGRAKSCQFTGRPYTHTNPRVAAALLALALQLDLINWSGKLLYK